MKMLVNIQDLSHLFLDLCSTREDILSRPLVGKSGDTTQQCEERERDTATMHKSCSVKTGIAVPLPAETSDEDLYLSAERYRDLPLRQHSDSWLPSYHGPDRSYEDKE